MTEVWVSPTATQFSCLCETCLEAARLAGETFFEAMQAAAVRGRIEPESSALRRCCAAGHELVIRRIERPPGLARRDARQLELA